MSTSGEESNVYAQLRSRAEALLQSGTTPIAGQGSMGVDALRLLHQLSGNFSKAEDALKLLHELQVHQVEIDLQNQEIASNEEALFEDLSLYRNLFEFAPMGYLIVDLKGTVIRVNSAAAELFGSGAADLEGHPFHRFLREESRPELLDLLQRVVESGARSGCLVKAPGLASADHGSRNLQLLAALSPDREFILLACCQCATAGDGN